MTTRLTSRNLRAMSPAVLKRTVGQLRNSARTDTKSRVTELRAEVKGFELKYKMTTKTMLNKVCSGQLAEKGDIEKWLIKHSLLQLHVKA
jgi:hypothetical protein